MSAEHVGPQGRLRLWDRTVKFHVNPTWLKVLARRKLKEWGRYQPGFQFDYYVDELMKRRWPCLKDHWGMRGKRGEETFFVMPYGDPRASAESFAAECGLELISAPGERGAWAPESFLFEFRPRVVKEGVDE